MKIDSVDFFYLSMPVVTEASDGSQDALLVRVTAGAHQGWGECEAAPLPSIAALLPSEEAATRFTELQPSASSRAKRAGIPTRNGTRSFRTRRGRPSGAQPVQPSAEPGLT
jgi:hypothetical protein